LRKNLGGNTQRRAKIEFVVTLNLPACQIEEANKLLPGFFSGFICFFPPLGNYIFGAEGFTNDCRIGIEKIQFQS
jgi:hypothetical protein